MSSNSNVVIGVSAVDTARQTLQQVDDKIRQTTNLVEDSGSRIGAIGQKIKENWQSLAVSAAGLTAGVVGFATSFGTLEKAQSRVDLANLTYEKSLARLNKAQDEGKVSAEKLALMQEEVRVNADKARLAQDDLGDTYTNFLANIPSQLMSFGMAANSMWVMLRSNQTAASTSSVTTAATYTGALAGMNVATTATTGVLGTLKAALISTFITNPVGLAILGISTVAMLLVTNFDAVSSAVTWLGKTIYDFLVKAVQPLIDGFTWLYNNALVPLAQMLGFSLPSAAATASSALDSMNTTVSETVAVTDTLQASVIRAGDETEAQTSKMSKSWQKLASDLEIEITKIETLYRTIPNPLGGNLRTPVDTTMFGNTLASQITVKNNAPSIVAPANFGTGNGSLGTLAGNTSYLNSIVKKNALGGEGMVYQPTLFLAGENGPEGYKFSPGGKSGNVGNNTTHLHFEISGREIAYAIIDDIAALQDKRTRIMAKSARQRLA